LNSESTVEVTPVSTPSTPDAQMEVCPSLKKPRTAPGTRLLTIAASSLSCQGCGSEDGIKMFSLSAVPQ
jgi:hypothetical protein